MGHNVMKDILCISSKDNTLDIEYTDGTTVTITKSGPVLYMTTNVTTLKQSSCGDKCTCSQEPTIDSYTRIVASCGCDSHMSDQSLLHNKVCATDACEGPVCSRVQEMCDNCFKH